jgi:hypothetical protein
MPYGAPIPVVSGRQSSTTPTGNYKTPGGSNSGPMNINQWLAGDDVYQQGLAGLKQNYQMFRNSNIKDRRNLKTDYSTARDRLLENQGDSQRDMQADFAARGMFGSGLYSKDYNDLNMDYQQQGADAQTSLSRNLSQLLTDLQGARRDFRQNRELLRSEAVRRRAAKYGITG